MTETSEQLSISNPEFDGGSFIILHLSTSPQGFEVNTQNSNLRHLPNTPLPFAERIRTQRDREPKKFRIGPNFKPKVGIRNLRKLGNTLVVDIIPVTFPTYKAISEGTESKDALDISNPSATSIILLTSEPNGHGKFLLQHRSARNFFYGDTLGASVAGYMDGRLDPDNRGRLIPVDTKLIKQNISSEMEEELGLLMNEIKEIRITGIAQDKLKYHTEFLLFGISKLSTDEITGKVKIREKEKRPNDDLDFEGRFYVIDGTPEAIFKLVTEVKCPLPPTHAAAFVATGYSLILERDGLEVANKWKEKVEEQVKRNYKDIDEIVAEFYKNHPEASLIRKEDKPERNTKAYDPAYTPQEQGLPDITSELIRVGLIDSNS